MPKMIVVAENEKGKMLANKNHKKCLGTGIICYQKIGETDVPIPCKCVVYEKKDGAKHA